MTETLEVIIQAKDQQSWSSLTEWLDTLEQPFVSGCLVDSDEEDTTSPDALLAEDAATTISGWPVSVYFESDVIVGRFVEDFWQWVERHQVREAYAVQVQRIPSYIWQQAWEPLARDFETDEFVVHITGGEPLTSRKQPIWIEPGKAFGSGQHATTKASLKLLEQIPVGQSLLDVGTGTGILAIAGEKLGYRRVVATDIDQDAWHSARRNREANHAKFQLCQDSLPPGDEAFDLIVCNILPPVVNHMMPDLLPRMNPGGYLLIAGIHRANARLVLDTASWLNLKMENEYEERGWLALGFRQRC